MWYADYHTMISHEIVHWPPLIVSIGPSHAPMQSGHMQSAIPSTSIYSSSASGYSHATPSSQGSLVQGPKAGYGSSSSFSSTPSSSSSPRSNLNMQSSQGEAGIMKLSR